jgi:ABC-type glutathione transport system ATPase component
MDRIAGPVIRVEGVRKRCGSVVAADGVSFEVAVGEVFGLLGPNGAGKTTTVEMLEGLRSPDQGRLEVLGLDDSRHAATLPGPSSSTTRRPDDRAGPAGRRSPDPRRPPTSATLSGR